MSMSNIVIEAEKRTTSSLKFLRESGKIPAVLYGHGAGKEEILLELDGVEFPKQAANLDYSTLITIKVGKKEVPALVKEIQRSALKNKIISVDFFAPKMSESVKAMVEIEFTGEAPVEKDLNGILVYNMHEIEVEAKPRDLPEKFVIDISAMKTFEDVIRVADLKVSKDVTLHRDEDEVIVSSSHKRVEEEVEETPVADPSAVEVTGQSESEEVQQ
jgi:large subunit ribosomal protein L25